MKRNRKKQFTALDSIKQFGLYKFVRHSTAFNY